MALWCAIHGFANGEYVTQEVLNRPIIELKERSDYLYARLRNLIGDNPFESVRFIDMQVATEGDNIPLVKDFVYLNPTTYKLEKAVATVGLFDNIFRASDASALTIGVLISVSDDGKLGTVVSYGKIPGSDSLGSWSVADLLETDEVFRSGPYYLSSVEPGKLTANPSGPAIYVGQIFNQSANPLLVDYLVLSPQYKDLAESHIHRAIPLTTQPAGYHFHVDDVLTGYHEIYGFNPTSFADTTDGTHSGGMGVAAMEVSTPSFVAGNLVGLTLTNISKNLSGTITANTTTTVTATGVTWDTGDTYKLSNRCRLTVKGCFNDLNSTQYTFLLAASNILNPPQSGPPDSVAGFHDVWLHWTSTDPNEASGAVQLRSYELPVTVGTKGLVVVLENVLGALYADYVESCEAARRTWTLTIPDQVKGWLAHKSYGRYVTSHVTTEQGFSFITMGGPFDAGDARMTDQIIVKAMYLHKLTYGTTNAADGNTITIDGTVYEFDSNASVTAGNVQIDIATTPDETFANLVSAIVDEDISTVDCAIDEDAHLVIIGVADAATVTTTLPDPAITLDPIGLAGPWAIGASNGLLVYDKNHKALVVTDSYWNNAAYWTPKTLKNGLQVMVIPYALDGTAAIGDILANNDSWSYQLVDEAPGTKFMYNVAMHGELLQVYPPIPFGEGSLVLNGVELDSFDVFPDHYTYRLGLTGLYWVNNKYGYVPWPASWSDYLTPVAAETVQNMVFHNVRMAIGNTSVVTSLRPAPNSPVRIYKCGTADSGTVGDLAIDVDLSLSELNANMEGYTVFKSVRNNQLLKGPVVSEVIAGPGIAVSSPAGVPAGRGKVMVSLSNGAGLGGEFEDIALENAKQEMLGMFSYIRLLGWNTRLTTNINTGFTAKFKVPTVIQGNYRVLVYMTVFGEEDIASPLDPEDSTIKRAGLEFSYSVLHDYLHPSGTNPYDNLRDGIIVPPSTRLVSIPIGSTSTSPTYTAYDPMIVHNNPSEPDQQRRISWVLGDPFPAVGDIYSGSGAQINPLDAFVTSGSLVAIRVKRTGIGSAAEEYTANLGFINLYWRLINV